MGTYEDALRENQRLREEAKVKADIAKRDQDRKSLEKQNWALKHPGISNALGKLGTGFRAMATSANRSVGTSKKSKNRGPGFALNPDFFR